MIFPHSALAKTGTTDTVIVNSYLEILPGTLYLNFGNEDVVKIFGASTRRNLK